MRLRFEEMGQYDGVVAIDDETGSCFLVQSNRHHFMQNKREATLQLTALVSNQLRSAKRRGLSI